MENNIYCVFEKSGVDLSLSDTSTHLATPQDLLIPSIFWLHYLSTTRPVAHGTPASFTTDFCIMRAM